MSYIPDDVWHTIAQYVLAQLIVYLRLATVSSALYEVFMSDAVWRRVDVYDRKCNISEHYLAEMYTSTKRELDFRRRLFDGEIDEARDRKFTSLDWINDHLYDIFTLYQCKPKSAILSDWRLSGPKTPHIDRMMAELGCFERLHEEMRSDKSLLLLAMSRDGKRLRDIPVADRDRDIVMAAVCNNGLALQYASDAQKQDAEIVHHAVFQNGLAIQHAPKFHDLKIPGARDIVATAIRSDPRAYQKIKELADAEILALTLSISRRASGIRDSYSSFWVLGSKPSSTRLSKRTSA